MSQSTATKKNWANDAKSKFPATTKRRDFKPLEGRHEARIESAEPVIYKSGSFGITITFNVESKGNEGRKVYDRIVIRKADGTELSFAQERLNKRLAAAGFSDNEIADFTWPTDTDSFGDLPELVGAPVTLVLEATREYLGKPQTDVRAVYSRD